MCYWILTESSQLVSKSSVQHVTRDDQLNDEIVEKIKAFNGKLEERLNDDNFRMQWENAGLPDDLFLEDVDENENYGVTYGEVPPDEDYGR